MSYYAPISAHKNLVDHWNTQMKYVDCLRYEQDFWAWIQEEYGATLDLSVRPERFKFENERDCIMFLLRWM